MAGDPAVVTAELRVLTGVLARPEEEPTGFTIISMTGEEAVSELFSFDVVVLVSPEHLLAAEDEGGVEHALLMHDVSFRVGPHGCLRYGMVNEVDLEGPFIFDDRVFVRLRMRIVPRAWLLTQRRNSRIFQHRYVNEIVSEVLTETGIRHRWDLRKTYPRRIYCTQYEETDYDFVRRLLAEEGMLFFIEPRSEDDFEGGKRAKVEKQKGEFADAIKGAEDANKIFKGATKEATNIAKKTGNEREEGAFDALGSVAGLAGDLLSMLNTEDEEAPLPLVLGDGEAGPSGNGDVFVFIDEAGAYGWSSPEVGGGGLHLSLRDQAGLVGGHDQIDRLAAGWKTRPEHVETRDYDFRRPLLELKARVGEPLEEEGDEHKDPPPGLPLEIYDHHGEYNIEDVGIEGAELQREQYRRDAALAQGRGRSARIMAGHRFGLEVHMDHGREVMPADGAYAVTRVHHRFDNPDFGGGDVDGMVQGCARAIREAVMGGRDLPENELRQIIRGMDSGSGQPRIYENRFECIVANLAFRPARPPRLVRHVTETATVMGPTGQDIYQDKFGRVKVQFHWDRQGKWDANTSCWLRVAQPWAGAGYGFQFIPRVGMEVLVTFLGGDTDRPVVVGSLYNGTHATPEVLPERMTRSGIRTQTSPKGGGFNELSFEDAKDKERVYIHAQRNFEKLIQHDHDETVGNRHSFSIGGDQRGGVAGNQQFTVGKNRNTSVGGNESTYVEGSRTSRVVTSQTDYIEQNKTSIVGGNNVNRVQMHDFKTVRGQLSVTAKSGAAFQVTGAVSADTCATAYVQGSAYVTVKERFILRIQKEEDPAVIRLECGNSVLELHPDRIVMIADNIALRAREKFDTNADSKTTRTGTYVLQGRKVVLQTNDAGAQLELNSSGGNALLHGDNQVCLNSPSRIWLNTATLDLFGDQTTFAHLEAEPSPEATRGVPEDDEPENDPNVTLRFTHHAVDESDPIADTRYRVIVGEFVYEDSTNGDGELSFYAPDDALQAQVTLLVQDTYPDIYPSSPLQYVVNLGEEMPELEHKPGVATRLANLGYVPPLVDDPEEEELDPATAAELMAFQLAHAIPETGELDDTTKEKLEEVYGS